MKSGVLYFNHGTKHAARLAVSLYSLRQHYDGPACILDTGTAAAAPIIKQIVDDKRLATTARKIPFVEYRKNSAYIAKAGLWQHSPFAVSLLLDADTVVAADPRMPLELAETDKSGFVVTRFSSWVTTGDIISGRIARWMKVRCPNLDVPQLISESLDAPHAAINTGVVGMRRGAKILPFWESLTKAGWSTPFCDELAAQLLIRQFPHTLISEKFNASPIYTKCNPQDVVIWHMHGGKNVIREDGRGAQGHVIWWPIFDECRRLNIGGIAEWAPAGDARLADFLKSGAAAA